ncbi:hypothetical protein HPP92_017622 [Vanilla planifolia]|uniref:Sulfite exporter TauE/SafE family protein n=1 Tax=Vanilla planifolia TaxID=51239 RepID=A0A835QNG3_VANPL|nr:hypothetical protein HPP92_017622 [Vanilla planifolia]
MENGSGRRTHHRPSYRHGIDLMLRRCFHFQCRGVGGGSLYLSILKLIVGMDLKDAASISAFMVTAGSMSNVIFNLLFTSMSKSPAIVDYDIALLSEPSMLLGVSFGVVCNVMFPEWLITALFTVLIAFSTYKTFQAGCKCWKAESDSVMDETVCRSDNQENNEPLLGGMSGKRGDGSIPWRKMAILLIIWVSFFVLHVLIANKDGKGMIHVKPCGLAYWLITLFQVPIVVGFTVFVLYGIGQLNNHQEHNPQKDDSEAETHKRVHDLPVVIFPFAALLSGILGGLFGVGGGLLINPFLIHAGVPPQVTAATTSFMVLFSSSMSLVQFLILGMKDIEMH